MLLVHLSGGDAGFTINTNFCKWHAILITSLINGLFCVFLLVFFHFPLKCDIHDNFLSLIFQHHKICIWLKSFESFIRLVNLKIGDLSYLGSKMAAVVILCFLLLYFLVSDFLVVIFFLLIFFYRLFLIKNQKVQLSFKKYHLC